ncbi:MAG: type II toxin-antitoxin system VapC family toxin [Actinomycetota bacterium]|nr:type II toxin-antitoxin system VapC family toxin [Actinomycetota bacterium]
MTVPPRAVLDSSAVLALFHDEAGADRVDAVLDGSVMPTVALAEVLQKAAQTGIVDEGLEHDLEALGVSYVVFGVRDARAAAQLWALLPTAGLSLTDRACLCLAGALGVPAVTADRRWSLAADIDVVLIR